MALLFDADGEQVDFGSGASLDQLSTYTRACWIQFDSFGTFRNIFTKSSLNESDLMMCGGNSTDSIACDRTRGTGADTYETGSLGLATATWYFIACTYDSAAAAGSRFVIYLGSLTSLAASQTITSNVDGSGALFDLSAETLVIGREPDWGGDIKGKISWVGQWNRVLTLGELITQQFQPHKTTGCVLFSHLGFAGTGTQPDWSGNSNSGTVTGATVSAPVPLMAPFGWDIPVPYAVAAAATTVRPRSLLTLGVGS